MIVEWANTPNPSSPSKNPTTTATTTKSTTTASEMNPPASKHHHEFEVDEVVCEQNGKGWKPLLGGVGSVHISMAVMIECRFCKTAMIGISGSSVLVMHVIRRVRFWVAGIVSRLGLAKSRTSTKKAHSVCFLCARSVRFFPSCTIPTLILTCSSC